MSRHTASTAWVRLTIEALSAAGLDVSVLCVQAGLNLQAISVADVRCPTEVISRLWETAVSRSGNPALAMIAGRVVGLTSFDVAGYAMLASPTLRAALERSVRYSRVVSAAAAMRLTEQQDGYRLSVEFHVDARDMPRQRCEFALLSILSFCRWMTGRDLVPLAIEFRHAAPPDLQPYRDAFRCPLRFGARSEGIVWAHADLALALPMASAERVELHDRHAEARIEQLEGARTTADARRLIVQDMPDGEPSRERIARAMGMSERTFQRRLQQEGTSFHRLLDDTRRELAERYLASESVSLAEVAYLLGFADQSSFSRASRRWFECPPRKARLRLAANRSSENAGDRS